MGNFTNYLTISIRNLYREKLYALINLAGLSLGIACCLILALYLRSELTYDQHFDKHENIYRINNVFYNNGQVDAFAPTSPLLGPMLTAEFNQEINTYVRMLKNQSMVFRHEEDSFFWDQTYYVDTNFFEVFSHEIIYGDEATALDESTSVAVSETFARRYFGGTNPIGEIITFDGGVPLTITLVFADLPENTHVKYDLLYSIDYRLSGIPDNAAIQRNFLWNLGVFTYLLMPDEYDIEDFVALSENFYDRNMKSIGDASNWSMTFSLMPLADIHLNSESTRDEPTGNRAYLYAFTAVALFIILVACINYTNLATARSMKRSKEVGMRKILGANRGALMLQFLAEALLFALLSMFIGVIIVEVVLALTPVNILLGKSLSFSLLNEPVLLGWLLLASAGIGLLAGIYPAIYLSSWAPLSALVSSTGGVSGNVRLRQGLVLAQFVISITVVACTLLMAEQMRYLSEKPLGFDKENRISIRLIGKDLLQKIPVIKNELLQYNGILGVTSNAHVLGQDMNINALEVESREGVMEQGTIIHTQVDTDYIDVMGMQVIEGRDFSQRLLTDIGTSIIVNEAMVRSRGWDEPLGKRLIDGRVIGVVEDFHFQSLRTVVEPIALRPFNDNWEQINDEAGAFMQRYLTVTVGGENMRDTLSYLQDRFAEFDPSHPFEFQFLDEALDELYQSEERLMRLIGIFSGICIFIACLGLFGLASFTTEQRNKEIGTRKVLGASTAQIIMLLSRSILILVLLGGLIASVLSYLIIDEWLTDFAYRGDINGWVFIGSALLALAVAYLTVALQSYKTAQADPVEALRYE